MSHANRRRSRTAFVGALFITVGVLGWLAGFHRLGRGGLGTGPATSGTTTSGPTTSNPSPTPSNPKAIATTLTIEWLPLAPTPVPKPTVDARGCTASDLRASVYLEGATMSLAGGVVFEKDSGTPCQLSGQPALTLIGPDGSVLPIKVMDVKSGSRWPTEPVVLVQSGEPAIALVTWSNWCGGAMSSVTWHVSLPSGASFDIAEPLPGLPVCNQPGSKSTLSLAAVAPQDFESKWPLVPEIQQTLSAAPGTELRYVVTLFHPAGPAFSFPPGCPSFTETVKLPGVDTVVRSYTLNCEPAGAVPEGAGVAFEMVLAIPTDAQPGRGTLVWSLDPPWGFSRTVAITITGPP
jgi:hypothetical protein